MNLTELAAALRIVADGLEVAETAPDVPVAEVVAAPVKRGRGRPAKGEDTPIAAPVPAPAVATIEEVRASLKSLAAATSQAAALELLKTVGEASNLTELAAAKYGAVKAAADKALPPVKTAPDPTPDPFEAPAKEPTLEDVKAAIVAASKRTGQDRAAKLVMDLGGKAAKPEGGFGPSWTALPKDKYAEAIAALQALPTTK